MRYSGTWLTPADEALLEHLREHGPASPEALDDHDVVEYSRAYVEQRCSMLAGRGGFVTFDHGTYRLTDTGATYLAGELDPEELPTE